MTNFLLTSAISMGVLLGLYHLLLEREKMHRFNRLYLLMALVFSIALPFISIEIYAGVTEIAQTIPETFLAPLSEAAPVAEKINYIPVILWGIYGLVTLILATRFALNVTRLLRSARAHETILHKDAKLVLLEESVLPHTFFRYIFISRTDYEQGLIEYELFTHELVHVRQKHTADILLIEALKTIFWFNPLLYFYKKAIQLNHEFLADENVVCETGNVPAYQRLLLGKSVPATYYPLASSLNYSITKKRFTMMTKTTTKTKAAVMKLAILPVTAALLLLSCSTGEIENKTTPTVITENVTPTAKVEVVAVTEAEKKALMATEPKIFDDPGANYHKIKITEKQQDGSILEKISYQKKEEMQYEWDHNSVARKVDPDNIVSIDVMTATEAQMDSLIATDTKKYPKDEPANYSFIVYKLKDGRTLKDVVHRKSVAVN